jgi:predicted small lipoprotein YifL
MRVFTPAAVVVALACMALAAGCGLKDDLYLPEPAATPPATSAPASQEDEEERPAAPAPPRT